MTKCIVRLLKNAIVKNKLNDVKILCSNNDWSSIDDNVIEYITLLAFMSENIDIYFYLNDFFDGRYTNSATCNTLWLSCIKGPQYFNYFKISYETLSSEVKRIVGTFATIIACEYNDVNLLQHLLSTTQFYKDIGHLEELYDDFCWLVKNLDMEIDKIMCDTHHVYISNNKIYDTTETNFWKIGIRVAQKYDSHDILEYVERKKLFCGKFHTFASVHVR